MKLSRKAVTFDSLRFQRELELMDVDIHASPQLPQLDEHSRQRRAYSIPRWDIRTVAYRKTGLFGSL